MRCFMFELEEQEYPTLIWLDGRRDDGNRVEEVREEIEVPTL